MIKRSAVVAVLALASSYAAATITFDDLPTYPPSGFTEIPDGYAGFNWTDFFVQDRSTLPESGYDNGNVSPPNSAFNAFAGSASFASDTPFRLTSLYLAKAYHNGLTRFEGYSGSTLLYSADIYATTDAARLVTFDWNHLTQVVVSDRDNSQHSVIDNITVAAVLEAETMTMLVGGLGLLAFLARRRQRA